MSPPTALVGSSTILRNPEAGCLGVAINTYRRYISRNYTLWFLGGFEVGFVFSFCFGDRFVRFPVFAPQSPIWKIERIPLWIGRGRYFCNRTARFAYSIGRLQSLSVGWRRTLYNPNHMPSQRRGCYLFGISRYLYNYLRDG